MRFLFLQLWSSFSSIIHRSNRQHTWLAQYQKTSIIHQRLRQPDQNQPHAPFPLPFPALLMYIMSVYESSPHLLSTYQDPEATIFMFISLIHPSMKVTECLLKFVHIQKYWWLFNCKKLLEWFTNWTCCILQPLIRNHNEQKDLLDYSKLASMSKE